MGKFLREGVVAGAAGGLAAAVYLLLVVEPILSEAIALEEPAAGGHGGGFSRVVQVAGGAVGTVLYGALLGVILGVTVGAVRHRLRGDDLRRSLHVAAVGYVSALLVPFLKYPPNPPGVGDPSTVGRRTALYLLFLGISVVAAWSAWRIRRTLEARGWAATDAALAGVVGYVTAVGVAAFLLPGAGDAADAPLPVDLVWRFRIASLGGSALLAAVAAVVLGRRLVRAVDLPKAEQPARA